MGTQDQTHESPYLQQFTHSYKIRNRVDMGRIPETLRDRGKELDRDKLTLDEIPDLLLALLNY